MNKEERNTKLFCNALVLFFFVGIINGYAQRNNSSNDVYLESLWDTIDFAGLQEEPVSSDTMLVICTTRRFEVSSHRKFEDDMDPSGTMRYLLALRKAGRWKIYQKPSLQAAAAYLDPGKDLVFYIEGMGKTFTVNLYRATGLSLQYKVNTILFDYPSVRPGYSLLRNFKTAKQNATNSYQSYALFLKTIQECKKEKLPWMDHKQTTLFQHSMANRMLEKAINNNALAELQDSLVNSLVLNAPCVDQKRHAEWICKINFADQVIVNYNPQDLQLKGAMLLLWKKQLGASVKKPYAKNTRYVNLNTIAGKQHNLFLSRPGGPGIPAAAQAYYEMLFHDSRIDWESTKFFEPLKKKAGVLLKKE